MCCSSYCLIPKSTHHFAAKRLLWLSKWSLDFGLLFQQSASPLIITACLDANWTRCPDSHWVTNGFTFWGPSLISQIAQKQFTISRSSAKAKYWPLTQVFGESTWGTLSITRVGVFSFTPVILLYDNLSITYKASNPIFHAWNILSLTIPSYGSESSMTHTEFSFTNQLVYI